MFFAMNELPLTSALDSTYITLSSSTKMIPPTTHQATSKEISEAIIEEAVKMTKPYVPILSDTMLHRQILESLMEGHKICFHAK